MNVIDCFDGEYRFLSNFYPCQVVVNGLTYRCSEAAFQSFKVTDLNERKLYQNMCASVSKRAGRFCQLREDWETIKDDVMRGVVKAKFTQNPSLMNMLIATGDAELIEGNTWNDRYWGMCNGVGQNKLGKILMDLRKEFQQAENTK